MSNDRGLPTGIDTEGDGQRLVTLGRVTAPYGVRGWVKVHSDTSPRENIVRYTPWTLWRDAGQRVVEVEDGRGHGRGVIAKLAGCDDRDAAERLVGAEIRVGREQLPPTSAPGEFYWADLVGLRVEGSDGTPLGTVEGLFETGANDVLVVRGERERLIPYLWGQVVHEVDLERGVMRVEWDPDF